MVKLQICFIFCYSKYSTETMHAFMFNKLYVIVNSGSIIIT